MINNISNKFKEAIASHQASYIYKADINVYDQSGTYDRTIHLDMTTIMDTGITINTATSSADKFDVGAAVIGEMTLPVDNSTDWLSKIDFNHCEIIPYVGMVIDGTEEWIKLGVFHTENPTNMGNLITLQCVDNMSLFEKDLPTIVYPINANELLSLVCAHCGVSIANNTRHFVNDDCRIYEVEDDLNCLDVIGYLAQVSCSFARMNQDGELEFQWYDGTALVDSFDGGTTAYEEQDNTYDGGSLSGSDTEVLIDGGTFEETANSHHIYMLYSSPTMATDDTVISGVQIDYTDQEGNDHTLSTGSEGYVIYIKDNPLINNNDIAMQTLDAISTYCVGMRFRKASYSAQYNPRVQAGDTAWVTDRKGNAYPTIISNLSVEVGGKMSISSDSETVSKNSGNSAVSTYAKLKKDLKLEMKRREQAIAKLTNALANSSGLYVTTEQASGGGNIYYLHDKPELADSTNVMKWTAEAIGISNDGGQTYPYGLQLDGTAILDKIYAVGIDANYITTGKVQGQNNTNTYFDLDNAQLVTSKDGWRTVVKNGSVYTYNENYQRMGMEIVKHFFNLYNWKTGSEIGGITTGADNTDDSGSFYIYLKNDNSLTVHHEQYNDFTSVQVTPTDIQLRIPASLSRLYIDSEQARIASNSSAVSCKNDGTIALSWGGYLYAPMLASYGHRMFTQWSGSTLAIFVDETNVWQTSDERMKANIKPISDVFIKACGSVELKQFTFTPDIYDKETVHLGIIAQDIRKAMEEQGIDVDKAGISDTFQQDGEDYYTVEKSEFLIGRLAYDERVIKQQAEKIDELESRLAKIEAMLGIEVEEKTAATDEVEKATETAEEVESSETTEATEDTETSENTSNTATEDETDTTNTVESVEDKTATEGEETAADKAESEVANGNI